MQILDGKKVTEEIKKEIEKEIKKLKITPYIAILGMKGNESSEIYIKKIEKNCKQYGIKVKILMSENEEEFLNNFELIKENKNITGIMFQQPLKRKLQNLINEFQTEKDVEGIGYKNMGKLFLGEKDALVPCTSRAVIETIKYYNINLSGKKVVIVGRSDIVGKPLIPQILKENATITICHSKTKNIDKELKQADIIIMAIGKANFLKKENIKENAILIDVGINVENGKIVGDIDSESVKDVAGAITPVPGGIGVITNILLIKNIIESAKIKQNKKI